MQALWSRTGLAHRCGCRACDQVINVGRRATTRATRRKATFADVFTALYSSVLATAAVVEAVRKDNRKKSVEQELERLRNELSEIRARRALGEANQETYIQRLRGDGNDIQSDLDDKQNLILWSQWQYIYDHRPFDKEIRWAPRLTSSSVVDMLREKHFDVHLFPTHDEMLHEQCERIKRLIQSEEADPAIEQRNPTTYKQWQMNSKFCRQSILKMLARAERIRTERLLTPLLFDKKDEYTPWKEMTKIRAIRKRMEALMGPDYLVKTSTAPEVRAARRAKVQALLSEANMESDGRDQSTLDQAWDICQTPRAIQWAHRNQGRLENTMALNGYIRQKFQDKSLPLDELIGHICLNMLLSPTLPEVHTYNLLMIEFISRKYYTFSRITSEAFLSKSRHRSTPASLAIRVTQPAMFGEAREFVEGSGALVGREPKWGAKLSRRSVQEALDDPWVQTWAQDTSRRCIAGQYIYDYAPMDLPVREALIGSLVHLQLFKEAGSFFLACLQAGATLGTTTISNLFRAQVAALDWQGALRMVRGLSVRSKKFQKLLATQSDEAVAQICNSVFAMMDICGLKASEGEITDGALSTRGICRTHLKRLINILQNAPRARLEDGLKRGIERDMSSESWQLGSRVLQLEAIDKEVDRVRRTAYSLDRELIHVSRNVGMLPSMLMKIGVATLESSLRLSEEYIDCAESISTANALQDEDLSLRPAILITESRQLRDTTDAWIAQSNDIEASLSEALESMDLAEVQADELEEVDTAPARNADSEFWIHFSSRQEMTSQPASIVRSRQRAEHHSEPARAVMTDRMVHYG